MKHPLVILAGAALMACTTPPAQPSGPVLPSASEDTCGAASQAGLIGKPATDPAVPPASRQVRHIRPNSIVTMDFSPTRLNIDIDDKGMITGLRCG